jgi:hypothetical protein
MLFSWSTKLKHAAAPGSAPPKARAVQPTYVTADSFVLSKSCASVRNTYEVRLALYFAVQGGKRFVLEVPAGAEIDAGLCVKISENNGLVRETSIADYSVYLGHEKENGEEGDGWVLGDKDAWLAFRASLPTAWLQERLVVGALFSRADLSTLQTELAALPLTQTNIDGENVKAALLQLLSSAATQGGQIYVQ